MIESARDLLADVDWTRIATATATVLVVLLLAWLALVVTRLALKRFARRLIARAVSDDATQDGEASKRADTLTRLLRQALTAVIYAVALLTVLSEIGVDIAPVLASAGIVGLAVGFGAQNMVRDVISGFFIVFEDQIRVGDVAQINGTGGVVERITLRTVILRDLAGIVHVFPSGTINTLSNMTMGWSAYVFDIGVAYKEETDRVVDVMKKVGAQLRQDAEFTDKIIADLEVFGVDQLADSAVVIKARFKTKPIEQWAVGREYLRRLKVAFDAEGIEIPFPHRSVYFGEASNPIDVNVVSRGAERPS